MVHVKNSFLNLGVLIVFKFIQWSKHMAAAVACNYFSTDAGMDFIDFVNLYNSVFIFHVVCPSIDVLWK